MEHRIWYLYGPGGQEGPFTLEDLRARRRAGAVTDDHFVWKEGLLNWVRLAEAPGFSVRTAEQAATATHAPPAAEPAVAPTVAAPLLWALGTLLCLFLVWRLVAGDATVWAETIGGTAMAIQGVRMRPEKATGWEVGKASIRLSFLWALAGASTPMGKLIHLAGLFLLQVGVTALIFG